MKNFVSKVFIFAVIAMLTQGINAPGKNAKWSDVLGFNIGNAQEKNEYEIKIIYPAGGGGPIIDGGNNQTVGAGKKIILKISAEKGVVVTVESITYTVVSKWGQEGKIDTGWNKFCVRKDDKVTSTEKSGPIDLSQGFQLSTNERSIEGPLAEGDNKYTFTITTTTTTIITVQSKPSETEPYIGFDLGYAWFPELEEQSAIFGLSYYPFGKRQFKGVSFVHQWWQPVNIYLGVPVDDTLFKIADEIESDFIKNDNLLLVGGGYRLGPYLNIVSGAGVFERIDRKELDCSWFFSLSFDSDALPVIKDGLSKWVDKEEKKP